MDRRAAGALLALAACIASSAAAPTASNQTALDVYDAASEGCYYNFQHYGEGDRIMTNEPCLNCTCHNRMLMCYLRVCPFTKPIGQDCTVEKRADQCCPIVTCPDVPVDLLTSTSTSSPAEYGATGLGKLDKYGCSISGKYFPEGSKVPPTPNKPCEHCYCIRNMTTCVMQECTLHVDGCTPIYHKDVCCPVRYSCDHPEDEMPLLDDMSTTVRPTPGFLLTTTTLSPVTQMTQDCVHNDQIFPDGTSIKTEKACEHCYCMKGDIVCVVQECGTPMENEGKNCTSQPPREGQCCPDTYICEGDEVTTEMLLDITTEPSLELLTTLVPPRRVIDEGSGYRKEEEEPIATISPSIEPEVEGSGDDFANLHPSKDKEMQTPSLIDERLSSTEDLIGINTTPKSIDEIEKSTIEPDSALNTVPSDVTDSPNILEPKLTTVSEETETSQETEQTQADIIYTTALPKEEEVSVPTTESAFRKEDEIHIAHDITTEKAPEEYTTASLEPTKITKSEEQEPFVTISETKATTPSEIITEIPSTTTGDTSIKESSTLFDHTSKETLTTVLPDQTETTTLNAQENEIEDITTTQGPGRIPGEGDCLQNGVTYRNESVVPSNNNCLTDCKCISSIVKCDPIICSPPPEYMNNCVPIYDSSESCCPTYVCDGSKETLPPQPHSQMSEATSSTPTSAVDCQGDHCEVDKIDKSPEPSYSCDSGDCASKPSDIPEPSDCGREGCSDVVQTPVQIDIQPECSSKDCDTVAQPHETSPESSDSCTGSDCQQHPTLEAENNNVIQPCDGENCKTSPIEPCQNEDECKTIKTPEVESSCDGESCKNIPPICNDKDCQTLPESIPTCHGENCGTKDNQEPQCLDEECKKTNIPDITGKLPVECNGDDCISQTEKAEISTETYAPTQEKIKPSTVTESLQTETTLLPEHEESQTSHVTTDKIIEVTKLDEIQTTQFSSEKPLSDSEESLQKTDKPLTDLPEISTTAYVEVKETTPILDLDEQTESKQDETYTTPTRRQETEEPSITEATDIIRQTEPVMEETKLPDKQFSQEESSTSEKSTEKLSINQDVTESSSLSSVSNPETETTEPAVFETSTQPSTELPSKSVFDITSQDQQYTKELESESGEMTTESLKIPTEKIISDEKTTEIPTKEAEKPLQTTVESLELDKDITTSSPAIVAIKTEAPPLGTSSIPDLYTTSSNDIDISTESHDKKTELYDQETQEPSIQTTSVPETLGDKEEASKQDSKTTATSDLELTTTPPTSSFEVDTSEKPLVDKEKIPDIPIEEVSTEQTEIDTEEPSLVNKQDEVTPHDLIEPESPDYIPVHPTIGDESDLIDRNATPESGSDVMVSTEREHPEIPGMQTEQSVLELEGEKLTEAPMELSPTDKRKYNQDTTDAVEINELTTSYPTSYPEGEKITESPELTSKPLLEEASEVTTPSESFNIDKQENIPTEIPESHVKETESGVKLTTLSEVTTEKLEPVQTEEPQTVLQPKPTETQLPVELDKEPLEHDLETSVPESTSEPKVEYSETTPYMIELVEHNQMMDVSTLPSSISDYTTISAETEKYNENLSTEKIYTSQIETESDVSTNIPLTSQHSGDETLPNEPEVSTDREIVTEQPEQEPHVETATNEPNVEQSNPEVTPNLETSSEIVEVDKISTKQPEIELDLDHQTISTEAPQTYEAETTISEGDQHTTAQPEVDVTSSKLDNVSGTEETDHSEVETKPDKQYSTKKPEIEEEPTFEPESTTITSDIPSTDRTIPSKEPEIPIIDNEIIPEKEVKPTVVPEIQEQVTPEKEGATEEPETVITEQYIKPNADFTTESPVVSETIKEPEMESSTEQKLLPEPDIVTETPESFVTEKEFTLTQESVTKEPEFVEPSIESSTKLADLPVSEDELQLQPSTKRPETVEPEQNIIDEKSSTEQPIISETEKETVSSETTQKVKPDEELYTQSPDKDLTTESSITESESSVVPGIEHKSSTEATITELPSTDRVTTPEIDLTPEKAATEKSDEITEESGTSHKPTTNVPYVTDIYKELQNETSTEKSEESTTILSKLDSETTKSSIPEAQGLPEIVTKEPETPEVPIMEHGTELYNLHTTEKSEISSIHEDTSTIEPTVGERETSVTENEPEIITKETPDVEGSSPSSEPAVDKYDTTEKVTITTSPTLEEHTKHDEIEKESTTKAEHEEEKLTTVSELSSIPSSTEKEKVSEETTETTPEIHDGIKQDQDINKYTTPAYTLKDETTVTQSETEKPSILEEGITVHTKPETEKPIEITKDTTAPEEEFLTVTKATTPKVEIETTTHSEDLDKITRPHEEASSEATPDIPKPGFNEVHGTDEVPVPEEESHFAPSATGGYGQEPDYEDENQPFGPGTCRYGGKVYVSAQQIPRDDPCDFCFCFRSDIICLQQSCPPPIHGCHEEPIQGFCCPRYECPVSMANTLNVTTTTTTTTTTLPPHFLPHAYQGAVQRRGCQIKGHTYKVGEVVRASSGPCLHCTCGGDGQMKCDPKACTPEPMLRQMIAAAVSAKRRR